jgi:hypothetical protein
MKRLKLALLTIMLCQNIMAQWMITNDTIWTADTVKIYQDVIVAQNVLLTIEPGAYIEFQDNFSIKVFGRLRAIGTPADSIVFTVKDTTMFADTATLQGGWGSIKLLVNGGDTSHFVYCHFSYGKAVDPGHYSLNPVNHNNKGGAVYANGHGAILIEESTFINNMANYEGGGLYAQDGDFLLLKGNVFMKNKVLFGGGGGSVRDIVETYIVNNLFVYNIAFRVMVNNYIFGDGGGLFYGSMQETNNANIANNRFYFNKSVTGALYESSQNSLIYNNIIANNMGSGASVGGWSTSTTRLINNTIVNNLAWSYMGCGYTYWSIHIRMRNNIVYGNESVNPSDIPIQMYNGWNQLPVSSTYSCNPDDYPGEGNITDNPLFVNPTIGAGPSYNAMLADWSLLDISPCVNTGTPDTTGLSIPHYDLHGNPRIFGGRIDMGAYENQNIWVSLPKNPLVNAKMVAAPNPFRNAFTVELYGPEKVRRITVYNQTGTPVRQMETLWHEGLVSIDMSGFTSGLYVLAVEHENGTVKTEKMVKM